MTGRPPDPRIGTTLGPYLIEAVIGRGGMGIVYLAEQPSLGRRIALKILPPELAEDADFRARFIRESKMAAAIDDPNILPVYEAGEIDGVLFIAMRYVQGTDLERRLASGVMAPAEVAHVLGQVASALDAAHLRGLVHRDVKPANILVAPGIGDDRGEHAYLADFGLTKPRGEETNLTRVGSVVGTIDYMAPEQLEGRELDGATDQYALAAIAFRALTHRLPFARESDVAVISAHLKEPVPVASMVAPELPRAVDAVLTRGMAKAPAERYPTCAAFMSDLRQALKLTATRPVSTSSSTRRTPRALWIGAAVVGLLVVLAGGAWIASGGASQTAPTTQPSAAEGSTSATSAVPGASATEGPFPSGPEAELLGALPADLAESCARGPYRPVGSDIIVGSGHPLASLLCTPSSSTEASSVQVWRFPFLGTTAGNSGFTTESAISGLAGRFGTRAGDCKTSGRVNGRWIVGGEDAGAIVCYIDPKTGDANLWWSYKDASVLVQAINQRGEREALYGFFEKYAKFITP